MRRLLAIVVVALAVGGSGAYLAAYLADASRPGRAVAAKVVPQIVRAADGTYLERIELGAAAMAGRSLVLSHGQFQYREWSDSGDPKQHRDCTGVVAGDTHYLYLYGSEIPYRRWLVGIENGVPFLRSLDGPQPYTLYLEPPKPPPTPSALACM
jgi:hypothetical protein